MKLLVDFPPELLKELDDDEWVQVFLIKEKGEFKIIKCAPFAPPQPLHWKGHKVKVRNPYRIVRQ